MAVECPDADDYEPGVDYYGLNADQATGIQVRIIIKSTYILLYACTFMFTYVFLYADARVPDHVHARALNNAGRSSGARWGQV